MIEGDGAKVQPEIRWAAVQDPAKGELHFDGQPGWCLRHQFMDAAVTDSDALAEQQVVQLLSEPDLRLSHQHGQLPLDRLPPGHDSHQRSVFDAVSLRFPLGCRHVSLPRFPVRSAMAAAISRFMKSSLVWV